MKSQEPADALLNAPVVQITENTLSRNAEQETLLPKNIISLSPLRFISAFQCSLPWEPPAWLFAAPPKRQPQSPAAWRLTAVGTPVTGLAALSAGPSRACLPPPHPRRRSAGLLPQTLASSYSRSHALIVYWHRPCYFSTFISTGT